MFDVRTRHDYQGSPDVVWATTKRWANPEALPEGIRMTGERDEGVGTIRRVDLPDGSFVVERIEAIDDDARTLSYTVDETSLPFRNYHATMRVVPHDDGSCELEWSASFDAPAEVAEQLRAETKALFDAILDAGAEVEAGAAR